MGAPKPTATEEQVRAALEDILRWDEIARSGQLAKFLSYIVEAKLRGEGDAIKAYSIAVDVFGRSPSFDPQSDPIVRVQARRLRSLLDQYYNQADDFGPVRIHLPLGRYVPEFEVVASMAREADTLEPAADAPLIMPAIGQNRFGSIHITRSGWGLGALVFAGGCAIVALLNWGSIMPVVGLSAATIGPPRISVLEFQNLSAEDGVRPVVGGLALELVTDLQLFGDIDVGYGALPPGGSHNLAQAGAPVPQDYVLSGIARVSDGRVQYGVILKRNGSDGVVWSHAVSFPMLNSDQPVSIDSVSRALALMLGSHRGPLDVDARMWLAGQADLGHIAGPYTCRLLFHIFRDTEQTVDRDRAQLCVQAMPETAGPSGVGLAIQAALLVDTASAGDAPADLRNGNLKAATAMIEKAVSAEPTSSFVWEQKARLQEEQGQLKEARTDYASALQLNPANDDALAAFGRMMAMTPDWAIGADAALTAVSGTPLPPPWYYAAPALNSLRARQFAVAIRYAETIANVDRELGPIVAVTAGTAVGNADVVNRYLPQILEQPQFRARGILPQLSRRLTDPVLITLIRTNLTQAGVPQAALDAPF